MKSTLWYLCLILVTVFHGETLSVTKTGTSSVLIKDQKWKKAKADFVDNSNEELSDEQVRKYLAMLKDQNRKKPIFKEDAVVSYGVEVLDPVIFPEKFLKKQLTKISEDDGLTTETTNQESTTTETTTSNSILLEQSTTTEQASEETTTENLADLPKTGDLELLAEGIVFSGHMMHWSATSKYLAIADIWGQKYLRFEETPPLTTTLASVTDEITTVPTTKSQTTEAVSTTDSATETDLVTATSKLGTTTTDLITTTESITTTNIPTTTAEPLPYSLNTFEVSKDVVYLLRPQLKTEGTYAAIIPVDDYGNITEDEEDFILSFGDKLHIGHWDLSSDYTNMTAVEWHNTQRARHPLDSFHVPSPAWIDPEGRMLIGSTDLRKFEKAITHSKFTVLPNSFEAFNTFDALASISCEPTGMSWSTDNATLYFSDGHTGNVTQCSYDMHLADASNCSTIISVKDSIHETAVPKGIATDENNHLWVGISNNDGKGALIEIDPITASIISTIELDDPDVVDVTFAGEDLDYMYILTKKNLYKLTGLGVLGMHVPDFLWSPDLKKRSIKIDQS